MQSLAGKLAALNHFLSRSADRSLPFFETLKYITKENKDDYRWTKKAENAFQELKKMILDLPTLTTPLPKETLFIYLAASGEAFSAVLLVVRKGKQYLVHYVSRTLHDAERNYAPLEKVALALRHISRRMRRFGLPKIIVTYNGTNFIHDPFKSWSLIEGIKILLGRERKGWVDEPPNIFWAHRTSLKTSNREMPYNLTFGSKAVIPAKIGMPTHRTIMIKEGEGNEEEMRLNLDLLKNEASRVENLQKLGPKWEGPYLVVEAYQNDSYKLQTIDDKEVPRVWHAINLRKCYL
ncbi:reverse transcriptase domain-containing protein [Tanacetum coccineum]|uniref:Reverse transcriptase domain-containing protein n=1 Tax=Tanacetum coccineum TaxID=301880 RepID=A0ABQ5GTY0_9ASTR